MYRRFFKRLLDFLFALLVLLIVCPLMLVLCVGLFFANKKVGIFFFQERPGFKTMTDERDHNGVLLSDEKRLTRIGRVVRSTSLDELPQLINVLKGDMSLIGPRPLLVQYLPLYNKRQARRHEVRPGITGWAQVNGRNAISWQQKFEYDVWYVDHISLGLDVRILFLTIKKVLVREGITSSTSSTMELFTGNN